jgi:hypothetical protein
VNPSESHHFETFFYEEITLGRNKSGFRHPPSPKRLWRGKRVSLNQKENRFFPGTSGYFRKFPGFPGGGVARMGASG